MKFSTKDINTYYSIANQLERFRNYFGNNQTYVNTERFLSREHQTPDADFVYVYEHLATYFYMNVDPQFQLVIAGSWVRVGNVARRFAAEFGDDLYVFNGYIEQLFLPQPATSDSVGIFLDDAEKIEVPEYYFKVVKHNPSDAAIVMITINNPYITNGDLIEFCTNICVKAGCQKK